MIRELIIPLAVLAMVASMLLPIPTVVLDVLLVGNLLLALSLLVSSLYITDSLKLSALPTMLLLATLARLSLNVATTRSILGRGEAGQAIEAFGSVVIEGNLVVGIVVFLVITLIQFIVIAKGSERVAEVAARFTLDALPGKQMAIDADVRAGLIDQETARKRRDDLQTESRFYGALDGAMKFVKGDAIAGLVVTAVNIIGGFTIAVVMLGMEIDVAVSKYTLLTIGDGLLSQIPALLNALSAGMIITRVARGDDSTLAQDLTSQLSQTKRSRIIIAGVAIGLALVPGMPQAILAVTGIALLLSCARRSTAPSAAQDSAEKLKPRLPAVLAVEIAQADVERIAHTPTLPEILHRFRQEVYERHGLLLAFPDVTVSKTLSGGFRISMRGVPISSAAAPDTQQPYLEHVLDKLIEIVNNRTIEFIDDIVTRRMLDAFDTEAPELISSVVPSIISVTQLTEIMKNLLRERIPVRNLDVILQAIAEVGPKAGSDRVILEDVRIALKRLISSSVSSNGTLYALSLDPISDVALSKVERERAALPSGILDTIIAAIKQHQNQKEGTAAVILTSRSSRMLLSECLRVRHIHIPVLAHEEVSDDIKLSIVGNIEGYSYGMEEELVEKLAA